MTGGEGEKLLPCPFCGTAEIFYGPVGVNCPGCLAMIPEDAMNPDAPGAWNSRASGWRADMENAPRDGTPHLRGLFVDCGRTGKRWFEPIAGSCDQDDGEFYDHAGEAPGSEDAYTHWMPLPPTPKSEG